MKLWIACASVTVAILGGALMGAYGWGWNIALRCDDNDAITIIHGHRYFCMDYDAFSERMKQLAAMAQHRGA